MVAVFVIGTLIARLRPRPMTVVLLATAATQVGCTIVAFATGQHNTAGASAADMVMLTAMYAGLFTFAAWLYSRVAHRQGPSRPGTGLASGEVAGGQL